MAQGRGNNVWHLLVRKAMTSPNLQPDDLISLEYRYTYVRGKCEPLTSGRVYPKASISKELSFEEVLHVIEADKRGFFKQIDEKEFVNLFEKNKLTPTAEKRIQPHEKQEWQTKASKARTKPEFECYYISLSEDSKFESEGWCLGDIVEFDGGLAVIRWIGNDGSFAVEDIGEKRIHHKVQCFGKLTGFDNAQLSIVTGDSLRQRLASSILLNKYYIAMVSLRVSHTTEVPAGTLFVIHDERLCFSLEFEGGLNFDMKGLREVHREQIPFVYRIQNKEQRLRSMFDGQIELVSRLHELNGVLLIRRDMAVRDVDYTAIMNIENVKDGYIYLKTEYATERATLDEVFDITLPPMWIRYDSFYLSYVSKGDIVFVDSSPNRFYISRNCVTLPWNKEVCILIEPLSEGKPTGEIPRSLMPYLSYLGTDPKITMAFSASKVKKCECYLIMEDNTVERVKYQRGHLLAECGGRIVNMETSEFSSKYYIPFGVKKERMSSKVLPYLYRVKQGIRRVATFMSGQLQLLDKISEEQRLVRVVKKSLNPRYIDDDQLYPIKSSTNGYIILEINGKEEKTTLDSIFDAMNTPSWISTRCWSSKFTNGDFVVSKDEKSKSTACGLVRKVLLRPWKSDKIVVVEILNEDNNQSRKIPRHLIPYLQQLVPNKDYAAVFPESVVEPLKEALLLLEPVRNGKEFIPEGSIIFQKTKTMYMDLESQLTVLKTEVEKKKYYQVLQSQLVYIYAVKPKHKRISVYHCNQMKLLDSKLPVDVSVMEDESNAIEKGIITAFDNGTVRVKINENDHKTTINKVFNLSDPPGWFTSGLIFESASTFAQNELVRVGDQASMDLGIIQSVFRLPWLKEYVYAVERVQKLNCPSYEVPPNCRSMIPYLLNFELLSEDTIIALESKLNHVKGNLFLITIEKKKNSAAAGSLWNVQNGKIKSVDSATDHVTSSVGYVKIISKNEFAQLSPIRERQLRKEEYLSLKHREATKKELPSVMTETTPSKTQQPERMLDGTFFHDRKKQSVDQLAADPQQRIEDARVTSVRSVQHGEKPEHKSECKSPASPGHPGVNYFISIQEGTYSGYLWMETSAGMRCMDNNFTVSHTSDELIPVAYDEFEQLIKIKERWDRSVVLWKLRNVDPRPLEHMDVDNQEEEANATFLGDKVVHEGAIGAPEVEQENSDSLAGQTAEREASDSSSTAGRRPEAANNDCGDHQPLSEGGFIPTWISKRENNWEKFNILRDSIVTVTECPRAFAVLRVILDDTILGDALAVLSQLVGDFRNLKEANAQSLVKPFLPEIVRNLDDVVVVLWSKIKVENDFYFVTKDIEADDNLDIAKGSILCLEFKNTYIDMFSSLEFKLFKSLDELPMDRVPSLQVPYLLRIENLDFRVETRLCGQLDLVNKGAPLSGVLVIGRGQRPSEVNYNVFGTVTILDSGLVYVEVNGEEKPVTIDEVFDLVNLPHWVTRSNEFPEVSNFKKDDVVDFVSSKSKLKQVGRLKTILRLPHQDHDLAVIDLIMKASDEGPDIPHTVIPYLPTLGVEDPRYAAVVPTSDIEVVTDQSERFFIDIDAEERGTLWTLQYGLMTRHDTNETFVRDPDMMSGTLEEITEASFDHLVSFPESSGRYIEHKQTKQLEDSQRNDDLKKLSEREEEKERAVRITGNSSRTSAEERVGDSFIPEENSQSAINYGDCTLEVKDASKKFFIQVGAAERGTLWTHQDGLMTNHDTREMFDPHGMSGTLEEINEELFRLYADFPKSDDRYSAHKPFKKTEGEPRKDNKKKSPERKVKKSESDTNPASSHESRQKQDVDESSASKDFTHGLVQGNLGDTNQKIIFTYEASPEFPEGTEVTFVDKSENRLFRTNVRWTGRLNDMSTSLMAIVEVVNVKHSKGTDGTFFGQRVVECPDKTALLTNVESLMKTPNFEIGDYVEELLKPHCRGYVRNMWKGKRDAAMVDVELTKEYPDLKSLESNKVKFLCPQGYGISMKNHEIGKVTDIDGLADVTEKVEPISWKQLPSILGTYKGIQGESNSCYLDSLIFCLFAFDDAVEKKLQRETNKGDSKWFEVARRVLLQGIVYPLRKRGFVQCEKVKKLRQLLADQSGKKEYLSETRDQPECIATLFGDILKLDYLVSTGMGGQFTGAYCVETLPLDVKIDGVVTSQLFIEYSSIVLSFTIKKMPETLIVQLPREKGRNDLLVPSLFLDLRHVLNNSGPKECVICKTEPATDFDQTMFNTRGLESTFLCAKCVEYHPNAQPLHQSTCPSAPGGSTKMSLVAVICIERSHYNCFVRCGSGTDSKWVFFDSMADQKTFEDETTRNIPQIQEVELPRWIRSLLNATEVNEGLIKNEGPIKERLFKYTYSLVYRQSS